MPTDADWCTINLLEDDGSIRRVAAEHARLLDTHPNEPDAGSGVSQVIRTGEPAEDEFFGDGRVDAISAVTDTTAPPETL